MGTGTPPRRNLAIFLDMENLLGGSVGKVEHLQIGKVVQGIEQIVRAGGMGGKTATVRAYANWGRPQMGVYSRELLEHGVEPVQIFSFDKNVKNAADIELCVDVLSVAHDSPWVDVFVVVSGDGGFVPLIRRLHHLNKYAIVVSTNEPQSGEVNPLLKAVADEYHQIDVSGAFGTFPALALPKANVPKEVADVSGPVGIPNLVGARPTTAQLRAAVVKLAGTNPQILVSGQVNVQVLGQHLRKKWPDLKYANYGAKNLGAFVEKYCGLAVGPTAPSKTGGKQPKKAPKPPAVIHQVTTREEYLAAVRKLFVGGTLGKAISSQKSQGMGLSEVGMHVRQSMSVNASEDFGLPKLHKVLQYALNGTTFRVVRTLDKAMAVVHADHVNSLETLPSITETGAPSATVVTQLQPE